MATPLDNIPNHSVTSSSVSPETTAKPAVAKFSTFNLRAFPDFEMSYVIREAERAGINTVCLQSHSVDGFAVVTLYKNNKTFSASATLPDSALTYDKIIKSNDKCHSTELHRRSAPKYLHSHYAFKDDDQLEQKLTTFLRCVFLSTDFISGNNKRHLQQFTEAVTFAREMRGSNCLIFDDGSYTEAQLSRDPSLNPKQQDKPEEARKHSVKMPPANQA